MSSRKISVIALGLLLLAVSTFGVRKTVSYLRTTRELVEKKVESATPMPFHLERLEQMINGLAPEIQKNRLFLAEAEVEVEDLENQVRESEGGLARQKDVLVEQRNMLESSQTEFAIGGRRYTFEQVKADLATKLDRYNALESDLDAKKDLLEARRNVVKSARDKVMTYQREQQRLEVQLAQLDSQLKQVESLSGASQLTLDHSKLGEARKLAADLKRKLDVSQHVLEDAMLAHDGINSEDLISRDPVKEIDEKFATSGVDSLTAY